MSKQLSFTVPTLPEDFNWRPWLLILGITAFGPLGVWLTIRYWSIAFISALLHGFFLIAGFWPAAFVLNLVMASLLAWDLQRNKLAPPTAAQPTAPRQSKTKSAADDDVVTPKSRGRTRKRSNANGLADLMDNKFGPQGEGSP